MTAKGIKPSVVLLKNIQHQVIMPGKYKMTNKLQKNIHKKPSIIKECVFGKGFVTEPFVVIKNSRFGDYAYVNSFSFIENAQIGTYCLIGPNVNICGVSHHYNNHVIFRELFHDVRKVSIGNNCWIGAGVNILPGISIGNNCIIGAGTVITKNVPDNVIAYGTPVKYLSRNKTKSISNKQLLGKELLFYDKAIGGKYQVTNNYIKKALTKGNTFCKKHLPVFKKYGGKLIHGGEECLACKL